MASDHRRLAAIVSADVAGYSRLMGADESGTLQALKHCLHEFVTPKVREHSGRVVKTMGDGLLLEFPSVVDAVRCAVDVQRGMATRNASTPRSERIDFRIGINLGDIIIEGDDIFGDGVNVAARLQALAEPGHICVSKAVRDQVVDKLPLRFNDAGPRQLKNIARPVNVYWIDLDGGPGAQAPRRTSSWRRLAEHRLAAIAALTVVAAVATWSLSDVWRPRPVSAPGALTVAVLPFMATAGDAGGTLLAESLTKNLVQGLARGRRLSVVSPTVSDKAAPPDPRRIGRELNVRYVALGEVKTAGAHFTVDARVVDAATGTEVWSDRLDTTSDRIDDGAPSLGPRLTHRINQVVFGSEVARADKTPPKSADAKEFMLHANNVWARNAASTAGAKEANKLFDEALARDPNLVGAIIGKFAALYYLAFLDDHADHERLVRDMDTLSLRAAAIDERDPHALWMRAVALAFQWRWEAALEASARSERLDPTLSEILSHRAEMMMLIARPSEALELADKALALESANTVATAWPLHTRCRTHLAAGRYVEAIGACEKSALLHEWWMPHVYLLAAYTHQGESAKAAAEKAIVLRQRPGFSIAEFRALRLSDNPEFLAQTESRLFSQLRVAGIPEQ